MPASALPNPDQGTPIDIVYSGQAIERAQEVLTPSALEFVAQLQLRFGPRREELLEARTTRREQIAQTHRLDFLPETHHIRQAEWQVAPAPADLRDRRVEITGPTERKMTINALNSGAQVWLADLEDANTPHWRNVVSGQVNLYDAIRRHISYTSPEGKQYALRSDLTPPTIVMRPRGWHLAERHLRLDNEPIVAAFADFGLYFFHNAAELISRGSGPYFYLPKIESHLEARLWSDVFCFAEQQLAIPAGTTRATALIETIPAAFEMDEILYELREFASGLNAGRWDYLFSMIKKFRDSGTDFVLPDRNSVTMTAPFMRAYTELLVQTCHKRGAFAMGGMAAFIPNRKDPEVTERALAKVHDDKAREAQAGFDGSWVAHPDLVPICRAEFDAVLGSRPNQLHKQRPDVNVSAHELLDVSSTPGNVTEAGLRNNVAVAVRYLASWVQGNGAVSIDNLMEDAATAEIARSQIWQWVHHHVELSDGTSVSRERVERILADEVAAIRADLGETAWATSGFGQAEALFAEVALAEEFADFLTIPAYALID
jgi:malate synthase